MTPILGLIPIQIERRTGSYQDGLWVDSTPCVQCSFRFCGAVPYCDRSFTWRADGRLTVMASVQFSVGGGGIMSSRQDEGERASGKLKIYTRFELIPFSTDVVGDVIILEDRKYRVTGVQKWRSRLPHYAVEAEIWDGDIEENA